MACEPTRFTTEGQEHLMTTVLTSDAGETTTQISTFQKLLQHLLDNSPKVTIFPLLITSITLEGGYQHQLDGNILKIEGRYQAKRKK